MGTLFTPLVIVVIFLGIVFGVILALNPQIFRSRATTSQIEVLDSLGNRIQYDAQRVSNSIQIQVKDVNW